LKLIPLPPFRSCLSIGFRSMKDAAKAIRTVFASGFLPSALEVADAFTLAAAEKRTGSKLLSGCKAHLIIELDGQEKSVRGEVQALVKILSALNPLFIQRANGAEDCEKIWQLRREFSYSLRDTGLTKLNEDIVVPRGQLENLFKLASGLEKKHGCPVACFGHAGDGNIHVNVMVDYNLPQANERSEAALDELFQGVLALGGVITGEHGIGLAKKPWWPLAANQDVRDLHSAVKRALDPNGILNPGKFVD
jgi:FAD/FMN-containing dehydrogenase